MMCCYPRTRAHLLILLDLSILFDIVLIDHLENLVGLSGCVLSWFQSSLENRSQFIKIEEETSFLSKVTRRVPQGSVLGPVLFSLYMLPLGNIILLLWGSFPLLRG